MALHHVNGDRHDNRLGNIRFLCPNCHSQTPNFSGRNRVLGPPGAKAALRRAGAVPMTQVKIRYLPLFGSVT
jgi:hypothetical protein